MSAFLSNSKQIRHVVEDPQDANVLAPVDCDIATLTQSTSGCVVADEDKELKRLPGLHPCLPAFAKVGVVNEALVDAKSVLLS